MEITFKMGQKVWWNDPAGETSGSYTIASDVQKDIEEFKDLGYEEKDIRSDIIILLCHESGSEAEVPVWELESI